MMNMKQLLMSEKPVEILREMISEGTLADFEPTLAALKMPIPRGYHHKDNLEHSLRVLQNAIDRETNGPDLILRAAALFHDIGKPKTRKLGTRKSVSFDGHESAGAAIVRQVLPKHGFSKNETKKIARLVFLHMRSHGFETADWTDSAVRRLISDANNEEMLNRLIIVFYADTTTMNENKMRKVHASVDKLVEEIARVKQVDARKAMRPALNGFEVMEMFNLSEGRELGQIMRFLNSDDGIRLSKDEAVKMIKERFINA